MNRAERRRQRAEGNHARLQGMELRYGGRTIKIEFTVQTTASKDELKARMMKMQPIARGEHKDMACGLVKRFESEAVLGYWINTDAPLDELSRRMNAMLPVAQGDAGEAAVGYVGIVDQESACEFWDVLFRGAEHAASRIGEA